MGSVKRKVDLAIPVPDAGREGGNLRKRFGKVIAEEAERQKRHGRGKKTKQQKVPNRGR